MSASAWANGPGSNSLGSRSPLWSAVAAFSMMIRPSLSSRSSSKKISWRCPRARRCVRLRWRGLGK
eukprot:11315629-Heterocapsa_arctica.AAC.1